MSWTPRLSTHNYDGFQSWDLSAGAAGSYSSTTTVPSATQDLLSGLISLKPGWPGIAYAQGIAFASGVSANVSSIALTFAADVTAGSCIVVDVGARTLNGNAGATFLAQLSIADSQGNAYVLAAHEVYAPGSGDFQLCYVALDCKAGPTTVTVTTTYTGSNAFADYAWGIHEYSGVASVGAIEGTATGSDLHSTGVVSLSVTTSTASDLLHLFAYIATYLAVTPGGGTGGTPLPGPSPPTPTTPPFTQRGNIDYDQLRASVRSGPATTFLMYEGAGPGAPGNAAVFDASGNAIDSGQTLRGTIAVHAATTAAGNTSGLTYANGSALFPGVGASFTGAVNTAIVIDGQTLTLGQLLLVKNDTQSPSGAFNGVYYLSQVQTASLAPILLRLASFNQPASINNSGPIAVIAGTANAGTAWLLTSQVTTVGTSPLTFVQFSGTGTVTAVTGTAPIVSTGGVTPAISINAATSAALGSVKPDGTIITVSAGAITVAKATSSAFGVVEVDGTTITAAAGVISAIAGLTNPMTTAGDIIYGGASGVPTRLAAGTSGDVLQTNGSGAAPTWVVPSGGGSVPVGMSSQAFWPPSSAGSLDDEFTAGSLSGAWTQVNSSGASATLANSWCKLTPTVAAFQIYAIVQAQPASTPWTITTLVNLLNSSNTWCGLCVYDGTKLITFGLGYITPAGQTLRYSRWTNVTTNSADTAESTLVNLLVPVYLKIVNDGTNLTYSISSNGAFWYQILQESKAAFLSATTYVGLFAIISAGSASTGMVAYDFFRSTP